MGFRGCNASENFRLYHPKFFLGRVVSIHPHAVTNLVLLLGFNSKREIELLLVEAGLNFQLLMMLSL